MTTNIDLYQAAKETLNRVPQKLDSGIVEEHVVDAAEYHDERNNYRGASWAILEDIGDVTEALCVYFGVKQEKQP